MQVVHQCMTTVGWTPIVIASHTRENVKYTVHCNPWGRASEYICECPSYVMRGHCRHQAEAQEKLCSWLELVGPEKQRPEQRKLGQCPRCGGPTLRQVIDEG